jgi:hypothetical protein
MRTFPKIQSPWKRDEKGKFLYDQPSEPWLELLGHFPYWSATEKLDGTNIRISRAESGELQIGGRTDRAELPAPLMRWIEGHEGFSNLEAGFTLFGEGIGAGIQKDGGLYGEPRFVLFDVWGDFSGRWGEQDEVTDMANLLALERAHTYDGLYTIAGWRMSLMYAGQGLKELPSSQGNRQIEGVVLRPSLEMSTKFGRVITKMKIKDFTRD